MVRINLLEPKKLSDQHLIAEYDEILMLIAYIKKFPLIENIPDSYRLGKGHMTFFKDKLIYLKKRHESLKKEMKLRNFKNDWSPSKKDYSIIKDRIISRLKLKPKYYRYYGEYKEVNFLVGLIKNNYIKKIKA